MALRFSFELGLFGHNPAITGIVNYSVFSYIAPRRLA